MPTVRMAWKPSKRVFPGSSRDVVGDVERRIQARRGWFFLASVAMRRVIEIGTFAGLPPEHNWAYLGVRLCAWLELTSNRSLYQFL